MADIVGAVGGLCLAAQDEIVDEGGHRRRRGAAQQPIKQSRLWRLALREIEPGKIEPGEKITQRCELCRVGRVVHPVHAGSIPRLKLFGGGDIRQDHEFLDQPMAVETYRRQDRNGPPFGIEHDPVLGEIELDRISSGARPGEPGIGAVEGRQRPGRQWQRPFAASVMRRLRFFVGEPRRRPHQPALKPMAALPAGRVDPQMDGEAGAVDTGLQRAKLVRQCLWQHRHDAVGEIYRVAAPLRLAVERAAGEHIRGDIGNRDDQMPAAGVLPIGVGLGPDGIVKIARVAAVDRHQRQAAQIRPALNADRRCRRRLCQRLMGKLGRDVVGRDRQQADRLRRRSRTQPLDDAGARRSKPGRRDLLGDDEIAIAGAAGIARCDHVFGPVTAVGRNQPPALTIMPEDTDDPLADRIEPANDVAVNLAGVAACQPRRGARADRQRLGVSGLDEPHDRWWP